jgi:hypothetical protein
MYSSSHHMGGMANSSLVMAQERLSHHSVGNMHEVPADYGAVNSTPPALGGIPPSVLVDSQASCPTNHRLSLNCAAGAGAATSRPSYCLSPSATPQSLAVPPPSLAHPQTWSLQGYRPDAMPAHQMPHSTFLTSHPMACRKSLAVAAAGLTQSALKPVS